MKAMSAVDHIYEISLFSNDRPKNISKADYGSLDYVLSPSEGPSSVSHTFTWAHCVADF